MAKLIIYKNQNELITLELDPTKEYIAGRSPDCDIMLDDVVFSRQHFKLFYAQGKWTVQSISKYSQLEINHRESDYFTLKSEDKFGTFTYEFLFKDYSEPKEVSISYNDTDGKTAEVVQDDKTFVPEMTSQEWSIGVPYILLRKDDGSSQTMRLEGDYWIIGRDEGCDISIEDPKASREHCEIYHKQKKYFIIDRNSSNGTLLNYKKIPPNREMPLKSGDQIQIGKYLLIFEIRDPLFAEKLTNLPMDMGYNAVQTINYTGAENSSQKVIKVTPNDQKKKFMMIGGTALFLVVMYLFSGSGGENSQQNLSSQGSSDTKPIVQLSPEQKDLVDKSYNLAKTLYTQGKYELALTEIEKIHALIPEYKDSKEIAQYSKNAIDTIMEQKDIERGEEEQRKLFAKVSGIVDQCGAEYSSKKSSESLQDCLSPALELDPENAKAAQLLEIAEQNDLQKDQLAEQRAAYNNQVARRKRLFFQAERLNKQGKSLDALSAYSRHIASNLPDPDRLEEKSKQEVRNLQQKISEDIKNLKGQAEASYSKKEYKEAISKLEQALRLDPQNGNIKDLYSNYSKELQGLVKNLYGDSVLEENLGNIEVAKEKWKKIRSMDVLSGEYYKKSGLKLKKYGL